ncbi:alanine racemase [Roseitranquillus sediminis]|uniref:alanine racemase n=1 Tax=Roseitranquillus sediminis TaxID=2809051 RepID=UPI001D0CD79E|nr:alanine racemase [Roseitranquillus sediminis]MBM9594916.1 alanine racemase [Roseitranquillus sediminis]
MGTGLLTIDLDAVAANWRALDRAAPGTETSAVVKADGYGLGIDRVAPVLAAAGARSFFVAFAEEGGALRRALGPEVAIYVFGGHMEGDAPALRDHALIPMLNSPEQVARHARDLPGHAYGVQLDSGMNRLGMEADEWASVRDQTRDAVLLSSHLACADEPDHPLNRTQLAAFREMTNGAGAPRSLAATGGTLLGRDWHFEMTRPGIGLYGGAPFKAAQPVVRLSLPVIQVRDVAAGESVGYGATWHADAPARIATVSGGYADGIIRAMGNQARLWADDRPCPLAGRVSMDLLTVDVTHLAEVPEMLDLMGPHQTIDDVADAAGTIGYEILTSLGHRYRRRYVGGPR